MSIVLNNGFQRDRLDLDIDAGSTPETTDGSVDQTETTTPKLDLSALKESRILSLSK